MGNCQSCLGRRDHHDYEENDETCLLYDDGHGMQYGSFDDQYVGGDESVESWRENDALQQVIAKTSKYVRLVRSVNITSLTYRNSSMVDVFEAEPHHAFGHAGTFLPSPYAVRGTKATRFDSLASKLNRKDGSVSRKMKIDWIAHERANGGHGGHDGQSSHSGPSHADDNIEMHSNRSTSTKTLHDGTNGPLVGTFADAAAAME
ncbi:hypothetical protein E4U43_008526 [Claviceps pusilla]|uniref:Uncharacterized protein n=1 Tax=Claviceps pusilla TaxID=123648 RepID=A0A9P7NBP5_9HYPO|nr:hypothetical protein E4U43_008526 [Claviceps pusilla]